MVTCGENWWGGGGCCVVENQVRNPKLSVLVAVDRHGDVDRQ